MKDLVLLKDKFCRTRGENIAVMKRMQVKKKVDKEVLTFCHAKIKTFKGKLKRTLCICST